MYAKHTLYLPSLLNFCHDNPTTIFGTSQEATDYYIYLIYTCTGIVIKFCRGKVLLYLCGSRVEIVYTTCNTRAISKTVSMKVRVPY